MSLSLQSGSPVISAPKSAILQCRVREAGFSDYASITALQAKYGLSTRSYDDWAHLWVNNPVYAAVSNGWPIGWVLENASRQPVGYIGSIPLSYEFCGKPLTVAAGYSWVVEEEYRSYAPWLMDTYFSSPADLHLNTTVNEQAVAAFSVFGSLQVPVGTWDSRAFAITNYRGFVESMLRLKQIPAARSLSVLIAPFLFSWDRFKFKRVRSLPQAELRSVDGFDQCFNTFWLELKRNFPNVLLGDRSLNALNWHFGPALARGNVWIITQMSGDRLLAYAIFVRRDKPEIGLTRVRLADFQCLNDETTLIPMLEWAMRRCRSEGIHALEVIGYARGNERLMALFPHQQPMLSWQYYYLAKDKKLGMLLRDAKAWRPYPFDGDATL